MLTPKELKKYEFQVVGRNAYKASEVDEFMETVYDSYEQMFRENAEIIKKLNVLADKVSEYKTEEDNIRNALLEAQRMKSNILTDAQKEAEKQVTATKERLRQEKEGLLARKTALLKEAQERSDFLLEEARKEADRIVEAAQKRAEMLDAEAQRKYDEEVGALTDKAAREQEYLDHIKAESAKVRKDLMDTYRMQLELLEFTPDFSEDVRRTAEEKKIAAAAAAVAGEDFDEFDLADQDLSQVELDEYADDEFENEEDTLDFAEEEEGEDASDLFESDEEPEEEDFPEDELDEDLDPEDLELADLDEYLTDADQEEDELAEEELSDEEPADDEDLADEEDLAEEDAEDDDADLDVYLTDEEPDDQQLRLFKETSEE
ncbi:MAG: DivIVA domain-containing protein [Clostridia bacterium]|nr:DivIVA domain-containing protein [Clostridia bacterium]